MLDKLLDYLKDAQKPLILMGAGARDAAPDIIAFSERYDIPIGYLQAGRGSPQRVARIGYFKIATCF
jgi:TPP-dependent trihydroxycyclohexane-1,2-dione (THcHDO) dehydratase